SSSLSLHAHKRLGGSREGIVEAIPEVEVDGEVDTESEVERAVQSAVPGAPGERHHRLFWLARRLKAIAGLADAPAEALGAVVRRWHAVALRSPMRTKEWAESWADFVDGWRRVLYPARGGTIA